ncbi:uncharacterized protein C18orf63-like isoform X2 [Brienomyrus brachyistius]|uniref:uncharacterized protein C18orf63-like isoform X2 n=1 Tax=Brienomyrus brachyistius TaxID=42636 RepID=UPI0020B18CC0|nr:uncharacterized protein C18orf63-like isoform X2 [Brienomyrus brachyistius]
MSYSRHVLLTAVHTAFQLEITLISIRMNQRSEPLLFFLRLPDLRRLCCTTMSLDIQSNHGHMRNLQLKTCREILFQYPDVIASPVMESFDIIVIMSIEFFKTGVIHAYAKACSMQISTPHRVLPSLMQACLSYTVTARLAPDWNKAGQFLIRGKHFLSSSGKLNAIVTEFSTREGQLCVSVGCSTVRLPPATLEEFDIAPNVLRNFRSCRSAVIQTSSIANNWCYILPSMKKGQIVSISHQMAPECPFQTYSDIQKHWSTLYGYELPQEEEGLVYCSVYFKMVGEKLFTYPLSCIRTQPVQILARVDLQEALNSFLPDLRGKLQSICGFPVQMTTKPLCYTTSLISAGSQNFYTRPFNLAAKAISRPIPAHAHGSDPPGPSSEGGPLEPSPQAPIALMGKYSLSSGEGKGVRGNRLSIGAADLNAADKCQALPSSSTVTPVSSQPSQPLQTLQNRARIVPVFRKGRAAGSQAGNEEGRRGERHASSGNLITSGASSLLSQGHTGVRPGSACGEPSGDWFECKPKKPKSCVQDIDVENYARNNQLSKVNATTLQAWLKSKGIRVRSREKKEVLIAKVSCCLSES